MDCRRDRKPFRRGGPRGDAAAPGCEILEDRLVLSQIGLTVSSLADSGTGSLRAAILAADAGRASDKFTIGFAVTGAINLQSPLPDLNNTIAIQGPGAGSLTVQRDAGYSFAVGDLHRGRRPDREPLRPDDRRGGNDGGASTTVGTLTISGSTLSGNSAAMRRRHRQRRGR